MVVASRQALAANKLSAAQLAGAGDHLACRKNFPSVQTATDLLFPGSPTALRGVKSRAAMSNSVTDLSSPEPALQNRDVTHTPAVTRNGSARVHRASFSRGGEART